MKSRIYEGRVTHHRDVPHVHEFRYRVFMMYLDLSELEELFRGRWLWSAQRPALAWFRRCDHLGDPDESLDTSVRKLVSSETGRRPGGPIRLLTHLRYFGYCMNPVSFYYCWDAQDQQVEFVVAEVHNTPWGERHCYVLDLTQRPGGQHRFRKAFHVSPFMGMNQEYRWRLSQPGRTLMVAMRNYEDGNPVFFASMSMSARVINGASLARVLCRYPFMTAKVVGAIHWQALKLWLKRTPFHEHPKHLSIRGVEE